MAQSLGAFTGPLVAARAPVAQLILLAPMVPKPGETAGEWWENTRRAQAIAELLERRGPMRDWGRDAFREVFLRRVARERLGRAIDEMAGWHLPLLSRPRELAERLLELAAAEQSHPLL